jgi:hypothetical protein
LFILTSEIESKPSQCIARFGENRKGTLSALVCYRTIAMAGRLPPGLQVTVARRQGSRRRQRSLSASLHPHPCPHFLAWIAPLLVRPAAALGAFGTRRSLSLRPSINRRPLDALRRHHGRWQGRGGTSRRHLGR